MAANQPFALAWLPCAKTCHPGRARQELKERPAGDILEVSVPPFLFLLALFFSLALSMLIVYFMCPFLFSTNVAMVLRVRSFRSLSYFLWRFLVRIHSSLALEMARARMSSVCRDPLGDGFVRTCFFFFS